MGKMTMPERGCAISDEENEEHHHGDKRQQRFGVVNGRPGKVADQDGVFDQRDEMKDEPEADGRLHDLGQKVAPLAQQKQGIDQSDSIKSHRNSQPD